MEWVVKVTWKENGTDEMVGMSGEVLYLKKKIQITCVQAELELYMCTNFM